MAKLYFKCNHCGKELNISEVMLINKAYDENGVEECDFYICKYCNGEVDEVFIESDEG